MPPMPVKKRAITLRPIGRVASRHEDKPAGGWAKTRAEVRLEKRYARGLRGLEKYSHVAVVFWMDRVEEVQLEKHPRGRKDYPKVGIFALRCRWRPNPVGVSVCRLLGVKGTTLRLEGLDALNGSPVLDVKPYWPRFDRVRGAKVPAWAKKLFRT